MNWPFWSLSRPSSTETCDSIDPLLSLYADGMASPAEARRVDSHLPGCETCRESLAWIRATQRTLASRPIIAPPANLHSRIALAIAASSAAPSLRPVRSFTLRPASYAAAASLAILGLVSYPLWHHTPSVAVTHPHPQSQIASVPPIKTVGRHPSPKIRTRPLVASNMPGVAKHPTILRHIEPDTTPVPHTHMALNLPAPAAPLTHLEVHTVKAPVHTAPPHALMASHSPATLGTPLPAPVVNSITTKESITPKMSQPLKTATNTQAPVQVHILPSTVTEDPSKQTASATVNSTTKPAGLLDTIKAHLGEINRPEFRPASFVISHQSYHSTANVMHTLDTEHNAYQGMIYTP